ncbi:MAG: hypothetical protein JWM73_15, partial [Solirubrobacterales bacterium]|nr:hypothetical protein [Solirubrobacterales bacterium]
MTTPLYLDVAGISCVALLDEPALAVAGAPAVLLPPPFGWEELCTYRSRYEWARDLAARGHTVLRLDLPGTGDSAGGPHEPALFDAWIAAVVAGARLLAERGATRVAAVGLGLGGLLAVRALAEGAPIDDLVLWAVPARGRAVARELRAFARLEQSEVAAYDGTLPETHDDGRAVVAGFLLMPETLAAIEAVDLATLELGDRAGGRALLLDRDGVGPDERLAECLTAAGMAVESGSGAGWGAMIDMPHMAVTPHDVIARADDWLGGAPASAAARSLPAPVQAEEAVVAPGVVERVVLLPSASGEVVGVAASPEDAEPAPFVAVFLNAGAIRRIGPGRMWVAAARRWAQRGVASVRVDLIGIGDAAGDRDPRDPELGLYVPDYVAQVREVLDGLERLGHPPRFALIG